MRNGLMGLAAAVVLFAVVWAATDGLQGNNWSSDCTTVNDATPTASDDISRAFLPGCFWVDQTGNAAYIAEDTTDGAANWINMTSGIESTTFVVCASNAEHTNRCDYLADGAGDNITINTALAACPAVGCTVTMTEGTWGFDMTTSTDSVALLSNQTVVCPSGATVNMTNGGATDRYAFNFPGTVAAPVENARLIGGCTVNGADAAHHGARFLDFVNNSVVDGLRFVHTTGSPTDEGFQFSGQNVYNNRLSNLYFEGWGTYCIELAGTTYHNTLHNIDFYDCQTAVQFRSSVEAPGAVRFHDGAVFSTPTDTFDGNNATSDAITLTTGSTLYIGQERKYTSAFFDVATAQTNAATLSIAVSNGAGGWNTAVRVRDNTSSGGDPFAVDGEIEWVMPKDSDWQLDTVDGVGSLHWIRITTSANLAAFDLAEIYAMFTPDSNIVDDVVISGSTSQGIRIDGGSYNKISNGTIKGSQGNGVTITNNTAGLNGAGSRLAYENSFDRADVVGGTVNLTNGYSLTGDPGTVITNSFIAMNDVGINSLTATIGDHRYINNTIVQNEGNGIKTTSHRCMILGNTLRSNGTDTTKTANGRSNVWIAGAEDCQISENYISSSTSYGVRVSTGSDNKTIDNVFSGNSTAQFSDISGNSNPVRRNVGYVTENGGTGTILSGATSVTVTHGLAVTPAAGDCWFIGAENPTNTPGAHWIDTYTATQMNLNVEADPGASNYDVAWFCEV